MEVPLKNIGEFGHYTVHATFTYGSTNKTIEVERSFWIIPTYMIIAAIAILVLPIAGIVFLIIWLGAAASARFVATLAAVVSLSFAWVPLTGVY